MAIKVFCYSFPSSFPRTIHNDKEANQEDRIVELMAQNEELVAYSQEKTCRVCALAVQVQAFIEAVMAIKRKQAG
jgi:hypothetical protein